ncbi:hypothetical protein QL285_078861 [Trifolium repens]|nr:hypothetical protein QL285_078861 [Trifolium repens]
MGSIKCCLVNIQTASSSYCNELLILKLRDNVLDCTLWDALSIENLSFYNQRTDFGPVVMIIKHARVKEPQGVYPLHLTNVWNGTGQLFDPKIHEIKAFLTCFILKLLMGLNINRMKSS